MAEYPDEVRKVINTLKTLKQDVFLVGGCVKEQLMGMDPIDWDLVTGASVDVLKEAFPKSDPLKKGIRLDFTADDVNGAIIDIHSAASPEEYVKRYYYTCDSLIKTPEGEIIDECNGQLDIRDRILRTKRDPDRFFDENPVRILQAVRFAAEYGFELDRSVLHSARKRHIVLMDCPDKEGIKREFQNILMCSHASKGLQLMGTADCFQAILGKWKARIMTNRELRSLTDMMREIDHVPYDLLRRLSIFYVCFQGRKMMDIVQRLPYDDETLKHLRWADLLLPKLYGTKDIKKIESFISEHGMECFNYLRNLIADEHVVGWMSHKTYKKYDDALFQASRNHS